MKIKIYLKRIFWSFAAGVVLLAVLDVAVVLGVPKSHLPDFEADAAVVLGAAPNSATITNRTKVGVRVVQEKKAKVLVLSGGKTDFRDESEAQNMYKVVKRIDEGIPVVLESQAKNTKENLEFTKKALGGASSLVIATDQYHLARSILAAKIAGFSEVYWDSPDSSYYPKKELRRYYLREIIGLPWYVWRYVIHPGNP